MMSGSKRTCLLALAAALLTSTERALAQEPFEDPGPPEVRELPVVQSPAPETFPELTFHAPPRALAPGAVTGDWPSFLGPERNGRCDETHLLLDWGPDGPRLVWEMRRGEGYASPVVAGERVLFLHRQSDQLHLDCLQAETGKRFWRHSRTTDFRGRFIPNNGPRSTPTISGDRVYVHDIDGRLTCLELTTGRVVWERDLVQDFELPDDFFGVVPSPLVLGDLLILNLGAPQGPSVAAFDKSTGALVWGAGSSWGPSCASPVSATVHGKMKIFVMAGGDSRPPTGGLMVMDPVDGALEVEYPFRSRTYESVNAASPLVFGEQVFLSAYYNTGSAVLGLDADGGFRELWRSKRLGLQFSNPVELGGKVYALDGLSDRAGALVCVDPATGEELFRTELDWDEVVVYHGSERSLSFSVGEGSLLVVGDRLLCLGDNGHLLWLDPGPEGAKVLARASLFRANESWTPPVVSRGLLYVCQNNNEKFGAEPAMARLLCFDLRGE